MKETIKNLVVGAGISGITIASKIADELKEPVLIIDKRDHIGGNTYDYYDKNGICIHKYGAHIFHTNMKHVWDYLSRFTKWNPYMHKVLGYIDGREVPIPFNLDSIHEIFPKSMADKLEAKLIENFGFNVKVPILKLREANDNDLEFLAAYIYEKVFLNYTLKQWALTPEELNPSVTNRVPVYISRDGGYFQDRYQGIPSGGYTAMMEAMLDNKLIMVQLDTDFADIKDNINYDRLFYSGSIDGFFDYKYGELPYRSVKFEKEEYDREYFQSNSVINYPNNYDFTRIIESKYFLGNRSEKTVVMYEYSEKFENGVNERYYPIIKDENRELYSKYYADAQKLENTYFLGRLGDYKYYDMDKAVARAMELIWKGKE